MLINEFRRQRTTDADVAGRVCVVTGASSGVGLNTARVLASRGGHVVMVCRDPGRAEQAREIIAQGCTGPVDVVLADLSLMSEVRKLAEVLLTRYPSIHVLVNNAGIHSSTRSFTAEGLETCFAVNHLAPFLLTLRLRERMVQSAPARILNVSSQGHRFGGLDLNDLDWEHRRYRGLKAYGASKTANLYFTWELAAQLRGTGVTVNAVHPGSVKTRIGHNNGPLWRAIHGALSMTLRDVRLSGEALYYLCAAPELDAVSGRFFNLTYQEKPHSHAIHATHRGLARHTWLLSEQLTGLTRALLPSCPEADREAHPPAAPAN